MRGLTPEEIVIHSAASDAAYFRRVVWVTLIGAASLGFAIGFVTGFLLK